MGDSVVSKNMRPMLEPDGRAGSIPPAQVRRIRSKAMTGQLLRERLTREPTLAQIAADEGITLRSVRSIVSGQRYQWVK
jgi:hypothetical protein